MQTKVLIQLLDRINRLVQAEHFLREADNVNVRSAAKAMQIIGIYFRRGSSLLVERTQAHSAAVNM